MISLLFVVVIAGLAAVLVFARGRRSASRTEPASREWVEGFSVDKYRPMERLLSESDYRFLSAQSGFKPSIARTLRRQRRELFKAYLRNLQTDFGRLHQAAIHSLITSEIDRPEFSSALARQKATFQIAVLSLRAQLVLSRFGIGTVDVRPVVEAVRNLTETARGIVIRLPAPASLELA